MDRVRRVLDRRLATAARVEPFVRRIVAGGLALVAGLWLADLTVPLSAPWLASVLLVLAGLLGLGSGIRSQIEY